MVLILHYFGTSFLLMTQRPNSSLFAVMVDPWWTSHQLREDIYRQQLASKNKLILHQRQAEDISSHAYFGIAQSSSLALRAILLMISSNPTKLLLGLLSICIDFIVSYHLYLVAKHVLWNEHVDNEIRLEQRMDKAILPTMNYIFGIPIRTNDTNPEQYIIAYSDIPSLASILYFCNPISVVSSSAMFSFQSVSYAIFLRIFHSAYIGQTWQTGILLGLWVTLEQDLFYFIAMILPILILLLRRVPKRRQKNIKAITVTSISLLWATSLGIFTGILVIYVIFFFRSTAPKQNLLKMLYVLFFHNNGEVINLSPSLSMQWYFFQQVFHQFRVYFKTIFVGAPYLFVIPLAIRLYRFPFTLATSMLLIKAVFQPVLALQQIVFFFILLLLSPRSIARAIQVYRGNTRSSMFMYVAMLAIPVPVGMFLVFHHIWLQTNTTSALGIAGNPNYLYFQCLTFHVFYVTLVLQFLMSCTQREKCLRHTSNGAAAIYISYSSGSGINSAKT